MMAIVYSLKRRGGGFPQPRYCRPAGLLFTVFFSLCVVDKKKSPQEKSAGLYLCVNHVGAALLSSRPHLQKDLGYLVE